MFNHRFLRVGKEGKGVSGQGNGTCQEMIAIPPDCPKFSHLCNLCNLWFIPDFPLAPLIVAIFSLKCLTRSPIMGAARWNESHAQEP